MPRRTAPRFRQGSRRLSTWRVCRVSSERGAWRAGLGLHRCPRPDVLAQIVRVVLLAVLAVWAGPGGPARAATITNGGFTTSGTVSVANVSARWHGHLHRPGDERDDPDDPGGRRAVRPDIQPGPAVRVRQSGGHGRRRADVPDDLERPGPAPRPAGTPSRSASSPRAGPEPALERQRCLLHGGDAIAAATGRTDPDHAARRLVDRWLQRERRLPHRPLDDDRRCRIQRGLRRLAAQRGARAGRQGPRGPFRLADRRACQWGDAVASRLSATDRPAADRHE